MTGVPHHASPLTIARESMALSRDSNSPVFQTVTLILLGTSALASVSHTAMLLCRELNKKDNANKEHGRGR